MAEQVPVLWCGQCNKPFTKQSALKRHGYYCRSNNRAPVTRRRSCAACAQAKTGCDNALPACSRCTQKGFTCQYPSRSSTTKRRDVPEPRRALSNDMHGSHRNIANMTMPPVTEQPHSLQEMTPTSHETMPFTDMQWNFDDMTALDSFMHPTPQSTFPSTTSSSPVSTDPTTVSPPSWLPDTTDAAFQEKSQLVRQQTSVSPPSLLPDTTDPACQEQCQPTRLREQQPYSPQFLNFSITPSPSQNVRSMVQRPKMQPGADRVASLIFYTLKSYPLMLRQNTLPPFIHPSYVSFTHEGTTTEPLDNCITLMHMMASRVQGSRKLFWRNVRQECERICDPKQTLNKWELLGAMQALSIYVLIRLDEGETEHNNLDYLLERAVILIAMQLSHDDFDCRTHHVSCNNNSDGNWQDWIYRESRRRLAVIYRILNKLIFFSPADMCEMPAEFVIAPLPAKRQLWEARDAQEWKLQSQKEPPEQVSYALAVDGEIVKLDQRRLSCHDGWLPYAPSDEERISQNHKSSRNRNAGWWAEWCAGMDSMGGLIVLAASMV
ncbi:C6 finger domain-containing [Pyrenophora seminiperda CCB06]|uniref:C6 finger domain-containing n=1 Tax=Pyrenophora seminiperda CCB06 TaxID=1302712 RepID=A0A3M7LV58_9PLEO|nr:C6 finger domain-containing [Pyrenophora seminiperda CCB06]